MSGYTEDQRRQYADALVAALGGRVAAALAARQRIADGLRELRQVQVLVSEAMPPGAEVNLRGGPTPENVRTYALALVAEVAELAEAMVGKAWAGDVGESRERVLDEFADVTAIYGVLAEFVGQLTNAGADEMAQAYAVKTGRNLVRATGGEPGYEANLTPGPWVEQGALETTLASPYTSAGTTTVLEVISAAKVMTSNDDLERRVAAGELTPEEQADLCSRVFAWQREIRDLRDRKYSVAKRAPGLRPAFVLLSPAGVALRASHYDWECWRHALLAVGVDLY